MNDALAVAQRSAKARASKMRGNQMEFVVAQKMRHMGLEMIEPIHSGYRRLGARWIPCSRVSGDFRALAPGGISVLAESKYRPDRLRFSDLEQHQVAALNLHHRHGGISLLAWSHNNRGMLDVDIMRWPIAGFTSGAAITAEMVRDQSLRWTP